MCTWVKNGCRGGDVFGCHSLGEGGVKGERENFTYGSVGRSMEKSGKFEFRRLGLA